jgi:hypothetical protein
VKKRKETTQLLEGAMARGQSNQIIKRREREERKQIWHYQITHLCTGDDVTCSLINCITDLHIIDRAKECIWLQSISTKSHKNLDDREKDKVIIAEDNQRVCRVGHCRMGKYMKRIVNLAEQMDN